MRTRTYLTTPPGREPHLDAAPDGVVERWTPGPAAPHEPRPRRRGRRRFFVGIAVAGLVALAVLGIRALTATQDQDPSLSAPAELAARA
ncbi:hypothetical protein [Egicoccus sp. AB-alg2]|uniref:hypothetical protein n=1 Tax=Egicoccus sp. AB-alg2 TaxID=3242693 RepID=UPI00359F0CBD